jgi:hypothetical protein
MQIKLRTRCGCERIVEMPFIALMEEVIMPLTRRYTSIAADAEPHKAPPRMPDVRRFAYHDKEEDGVRVYVEV